MVWSGVSRLAIQRSYSSSSQESRRKRNNEREKDKVRKDRLRVEKPRRESSRNRARLVAQDSNGRGSSTGSVRFPSCWGCGL